ncbi:hypothetical protein LOD99_9346 [Oopsacas minuta]|uniref:Uncharacterized protein n=1 Tax=Oopsacas minuta TaxID=111878 RepID=A0AAV7JBX3_9METZ|nr:hypothetical protein LOD99_9346 [Oopsacas minuta]
MDNWYSREFFPPTLPVWRESDPKPFKLANLLNLTNMSDEPFSVGAGQLLMPREFSPVDIPVREIISEFIDDTQEVVGHQNDQIDTELGLKQFPLKSDKFEEVMTVERNVNQKEITSGDSTPDGHAAKVDIPENIEVFQITQMEFVNEITNKPFCSDVIPIPDTCNSETEPVGKNNRFNGPPKIPELNGSLVDTPSPLPTSYTSHSVQGKTEDDTTTVKAVPIQKQPIKEGSKKPENQIYKEKSKSTSFVSHDPVAEDDSHWKKVGDKKHKAKINKVTQPNFNNDALQVEESVLSNTKYISQSKNSAHRPKLDELDSFSINKQNVKLTPPVFIPNPQDEASIVNLDVILTEQSLEEVSNKNLKRTMLSTRKLEEATQQAKKHTWTTNPTDTLPLSFLAIESEQKKTFSESLAQAEKIRIKESQTNNQPVSVSTWARITKNLSESSDEPGSGIGETAANKRTNTKPVAPIAETDETIGVSFIKSKSEDFIKPKQKELATKLLAPRNIPDGILLSQACYEWSRKEILFLNKLVDPATVICFLQEFNELFEMTQLGSEMLGTSERTNALCKRIYEDLARIKKTKQKFTRSQENGEDWIKVSKKSGKTTKKKGKPSKSSEN